MKRRFRLIYSRNRGVSHSFDEAREVLGIWEVTRTHPVKTVTALGLDKNFERQRTDMRARNEWSMGTLNRLDGFRVWNGEQFDEATFVAARK